MANIGRPKRIRHIERVPVNPPAPTPAPVKEPAEPVKEPVPV